MREISLASFTDIYDAMLWLEQYLLDFQSMGYEDIKGEITLVNNEWRVGVITDTSQLEMEFEFDTE